MIREIEKDICESRSKPQDLVILFLDPVHQLHNSENGRCWQKKGRSGTKEILANSGRTRVNIVGAVNPLDQETTSLITEANCDSFLLVSFLEEVRKQYSLAKEIRIYLDNAPYNHAYRVQDKAKELGIVLKYLPGYCPNLNLIERLWKFFKKKIVNNLYYKEFTEFINQIIMFFQNISDYKEELKILLNPKFEIIRRV